MCNFLLRDSKCIISLAPRNNHNYLRDTKRTSLLTRGLANLHQEKKRGLTNWPHCLLNYLYDAFICKSIFTMHVYLQFKAFYKFPLCPRF